METIFQDGKSGTTANMRYYTNHDNEHTQQPILTPIKHICNQNLKKYTARNVNQVIMQ